MARLVSVVSLLVLVVACVSAQNIAWDDMRVTYSFNEAGGYFKVPRTKVDADAEGWTQPPEVTDDTYDILCPEQDPTICIVLSKATGDINGIEMAFQVADTAGPLVYADHPMYVRQNRFGYDVYVTTVYTVKPGSKRSMEPRAAGEKLETGDGAWMKIGPKGVPNFEIPRLQAGMENSLFTLENCVPGMGTHYYYNISTSLACEDLEPQFALYKEGEMIGFGIQTWGTPQQIASHKWFEPVPYIAVRPTIPNCPQCMVDWAKEYKIISIHFYFIDQPWTLACN